MLLIGTAQNSYSFVSIRDIALIGLSALVVDGGRHYYQHRNDNDYINRTVSSTSADIGYVVESTGYIIIFIGDNVSHIGIELKKRSSSHLEPSTKNQAKDCSCQLPTDTSQEPLENSNGDETPEPEQAK